MRRKIGDGDCQLDNIQGNTTKQDGCAVTSLIFTPIHRAPQLYQLPAPGIVSAAGSSDGSHVLD